MSIFSFFFVAQDVWRAPRLAPKSKWTGRGRAGWVGGEWRGWGRDGGEGQERGARGTGVAVTLFGCGHPSYRLTVFSETGKGSVVYVSRRD